MENTDDRPERAGGCTARRRRADRPGSDGGLPARLGEGSECGHTVGGRPRPEHRRCPDGDALGQLPRHIGGATWCRIRLVRRGHRGRRRNRPQHRTDARNHGGSSDPHSCHRPRSAQRRGEEGSGRTRTVVSPGPVVVRDVFDRRQRRDQCRWALLRQVRSHHRLRTWTGRGAGRWHRGATGWPAPERRCRALTHEAVRRKRGHSRHHHRNHRSPHPRAASCQHGRRDVRVGTSCYGSHSRDHSLPATVDARVHGSRLHRRGRGCDEDGPRPGRVGDAHRAFRFPGRGSRTRGRNHGCSVQRGRRNRCVHHRRPR